MNLLINKPQIFFHGVDNVTRTGITILLSECYAKGKTIIFTNEYTMRNNCTCSESPSEIIWIGLSKRKLPFLNSLCMDDKVQNILTKLMTALACGNPNFCWYCKTLKKLTMEDKLIISALKKKEVIDAAKELNVNVKTLYTRVSNLQKKLEFTHRIDFRLWCINYTNSTSKVNISKHIYRKKYTSQTGSRMTM